MHGFENNGESMREYRFNDAEALAMSTVLSWYGLMTGAAASVRKGDIPKAKSLRGEARICSELLGKILAQHGRHMRTLYDLSVALARPASLHSKDPGVRREAEEL